MVEKEPTQKKLDLAYGEFGDTKSTVDANEALMKESKEKEKPDETKPSDDIMKP